MLNVLAKLESPTIVLLEGLLSTAECEDLIAFAGDGFEQSLVATATLDNTRHRARTSDSMYVGAGKHPTIDALRDRAATFAGLPTSHAEPVAITRYRPGQKYDEHYDYFRADSPHLESGGQRVSTFVVYLQAPNAGGETQFPRVDQLKITPKVGAAVYFEYGGADRERSLHAGLPVTSGEKIIATIWFRERPYVKGPVSV